MNLILLLFPFSTAAPNSASVPVSKQDDSDIWLITYEGGTSMTAVDFGSVEQRKRGLSPLSLLLEGSEVNRIP
jgi:hypothetical protein